MCFLNISKNYDRSPEGFCCINLVRDKIKKMMRSLVSNVAMSCTLYASIHLNKFPTIPVQHKKVSFEHK